MKLAGLISVLALLGCASSVDNLQRATANSVPGAASRHIEVANVDRGALDVRWTAMVAGRSYACSADDMVHRPVCSPQ